MKLTDLLSIDDWMELEKDITDRSGLDANVFNTDGYRITEYKAWANRFCPEVKAIPKGQSFICAVAHSNIAAQARQTKKPVIEECDAGLMKAVVPVFVGDEFLGVVGGCGVILDGNEVESFLVNKITDMEEAKIDSLAHDIPHIEPSDAESLLAYIQERIDLIVRNYEQRKKNEQN